MLNIVSLIIHFVCLIFFIRLFFKSSSEMYFHPLLRFVRNYTDPVLGFLKNNKILNNVIHPVVPILILLLIKSLLVHSASTTPFTSQIFLKSILQFSLFLFKFYIIIFWLIFSSDRYYYYDDFFHVLNVIFAKTISTLAKAKKQVSIRNNALQSLMFILIIFMILFTSIITLLYISQTSIKNISVFFLLFTSIKLILLQILELMKILPQLMFIRIILSWFSPPVTRPLVILNALTEPILTPARQLLNFILTKMGISTGIMDFSPILAFFGLFYIITIFETVISRIP